MSNVPKLPQLIANAKRQGWGKYIRTEVDERAVLGGCYFDVAAAQHVVEFFPRFLRHSKGKWAGQAFELLDWQREDIFFPLFGWKRDDGTRRYRTAYVEIPKKNGKSTIAAGVGLYLLVGDREGGAEVYSAATDRQQASIVHGEAVNMVKSSAVLERALNINASTHNIAFPQTSSFYRSLSADAENKEGVNAHGIICDELHVWYGRKLWDTLRFAGAARSQPLIFAITTAGSDMTGVCREQHDFVRMIEKGEVKGEAAEQYFGYIRAAGAEDDVDSPETWAKANPSLDVTFSKRDFAAQLEEAKTSPSKMSAFKRYRLNIWSTSTNPWLLDHQWKACKRTYTRADLKGRKCWGGLDLSHTQDMTALALIFPEPDEDAYSLLPFFWLPERTADDPDVTNPYRDWAEQGYLTKTPGNICDYEFIRNAIKELADEFEIVDIGYDRHNASHLVQQTQELHGVEFVEFPQTITTFNEPTKAFERHVIGGTMNHDGHPILSWQAGHVQVRTDANGNMRPVKPMHGDKKKIDGMVAAIMALGRARASAGDGPSVYDTRGPILL